MSFRDIQIVGLEETGKDRFGSDVEAVRRKIFGVTSYGLGMKASQGQE